MLRLCWLNFELEGAQLPFLSPLQRRSAKNSVRLNLRIACPLNTTRDSEHGADGAAELPVSASGMALGTARFNATLGLNFDLTPYHSTDFSMERQGLRSTMVTNIAKNIAAAGPRTIGRLAKEAGVHVETIRFYERRGLLRQPKSPASGWRVYDSSAVWILHYIKLGRQLGFTLSELRALLANVDRGKSFCKSVQQAYQDKIQLLDQKIGQMKRMRRDLRKALADCIAQSASGNCPIAERCSARLKTALGASSVSEAER